MERDDIFRHGGERPSLALPSETLLDEQFRVGRVLGAGGFGITYLAFDEVLEMVVAVKEYVPQHLAVDRTDDVRVSPRSTRHEEDFQFGLDRFLQEARTLAKFEDHPNIARVRTFFQENGTGYLVMNYYEGATLDDYVEARGGWLPEDEALYVVHRVLDGLHEAHEAGVLHRDVDPSNVYLTKDGRVVLLDFGAARVAVGERTKTLSVMVKRGYAPHEQYHSRGEQGPWTDVYATAATLYRLLTGYKPPEAPARVMDENLVSPAEISPSLSEAVNRAVVKGLAVRPQDRPRSIEAFRALLPECPGIEAAHWRGSDALADPEPVEPTSTGSGNAHVNVSASADCRLYVNGRVSDVLGAGETVTLRLSQGPHRLRAVRTDRASSSGGTVTVTSTQTAGAHADDSEYVSLDRLIWQDEVVASEADPVSVQIDFDADEAGDGAAPRSTSDGTGTAPAPPEPSESEPAESELFEPESSDSSSSDSSFFDEPAPQPSSSKKASSEKASPEKASSEKASPGVASDRTAGQTAAPDDSTPRRTSTSREEAELAGARGADPRDADASKADASEADASDPWGAVKEAAQDAVQDAGAVAARTSRKAARQAARGAHAVGAAAQDLFRETKESAGALPSAPTLPSASSVASRLSAHRWTVATVAVLLLAVAGWAFVPVGALLNEPPTPRPDDAVTQRDAVTVDVLANDDDPDGDAVRLAGIASVASDVGAATRVGSTKVRFQPSEAFAGTAEIRYTVADARGDSAASRLRVRVPYHTSPQILARDVGDPQSLDAANLNAANLDDDGRADLIAASYTGERIRIVSADGTRQTALGQGLEGAIDASAADFNGDGAPDVVAAAFRNDAVYAFENRRPASSDTADIAQAFAFGDAVPVATDLPGALAARPADVDGDGDLDVVTASRIEGRIAWVPNQSRDGTREETGATGLAFADPRPVGDGIEGLEALDVSDVDGDGDPDVLCVDYRRGAVLWYENDGATFTRHLVSDDVAGALDVHAGDFNGDGRTDVVAASAEDDRVVWFPQTAVGDSASTGADSTSSSPVTFGPARVIAEEVGDVEAIASGDVDADGDLDVVTGGFQTGVVAWHANDGGDPSARFAARHLITREVPEALAVHVGDLDGDGDLDLAAVSQAEDSVVWFESALEAAPQ